MGMFYTYKSLDIFRIFRHSSGIPRQLYQTSFILNYNIFKNFSTNYHPVSLASVVEENANSDPELADILQYSKDNRIIFSSVLNALKLKVPRYKEKNIKKKILESRQKELYRSSVPLVVEKVLKDKYKKVDQKEKNITISKPEEPFQFPFSEVDDVDLKLLTDNKPKENHENYTNTQTSVKQDIELRLKAYNEKLGESEEFPQVKKYNETEEDVRMYEDTLLSNLSQTGDDIEFTGTPDSSIQRSSVPCSGCGAFLHCQDEGIPGYIPSEIFRYKTNKELREIECQRCIFLTKHKTALNIRVSPDVYERALSPITRSNALVVVIVDLMDVPCSVWPGLYKLIGSKRPVIVVGNKVDLLPLDNPDFHSTIKSSLIKSLKETCLSKTNIRHICLVSAKTGYGIEDLITHIQVKWGTKGDIYLIGCTNAGKSSIFNALLRSDMCQVMASSLIKRATASPWPGTTLNLLKFPLLKPTGKRLFDRQRRVSSEAKKSVEDELMGIAHTPAIKPPTLTGHIGRTFHLTGVGDPKDSDSFNISAHTIPIDTQRESGIDPDSKEYSNCRWCYDTPGTVHPDQFLSLLSLDELVDVLPRNPIVTRTFFLGASQSLFIGGVARLDFLYSPSKVRFSVCCSSNLPITIVSTCEASSFYETYLGTRLLHVPRGSGLRLARWPALKPTNVSVTGKFKQATADVVLSSAGFISVYGEDGKDIDLRAWTPGGRGVYVRSPPMLPFAFKYMGKKIRDSPMYNIRQSSAWIKN